MKQTAVDLFCTNITEHIEEVFNGSIQLDEFAKRMRQSYGEAKEMELQHIIDAWNDGMKSDNGHFGTPEQYYTQTFTEAKND